MYGGVLTLVSLSIHPEASTQKQPPQSSCTAGDAARGGSPVGLEAAAERLIHRHAHDPMTCFRSANG